jgi:Secretion system C-terminal sorting domain
MRHYLLSILATLLCGNLLAQKPTWAKDVAPILYKHCVSCHREEGIGHFSLIGYNNAFSRRMSIRGATGSKQMPPWKADPTYRHFAEQNILSADQIKLIDDWVTAGAPGGNMEDAPQPPKFVTGSAVGVPDQVLKTPVHTMASSSDEYRCFVIPNGLTQASFLRAMEVIPGNHMAVHHVLIYEDTTGAARRLDQRTPEPGYISFGSVGVSSARLVGAWVPGQRISLLPPFMGVKLSPRADLVVQVHFPANAKGLTEQSTINLFFTPTRQNIREVYIAPLINHVAPSLQNGPLFIPANTVRTFNAQFRLPINGSLIGVAPHMHLIGRSMTCFGIGPRGDTIRFIRIPQWDFHWQGNYTFQKVQPIPAGTSVRAIATYDNTSNNPFNPSNPPRNVSLGEATTDEMMLVYFMFMENRPGDENIVLDSTLLLPTTAVRNPVSNTLDKLHLSPNPADDVLNLSFDLRQQSDLQIGLYDLLGRSVRTIAVRQNVAPGIYTESVPLQDLPPGIYVAKIQAGGQAVLAGKFVVQRR